MCLQTEVDEDSQRFPVKTEGLHRKPQEVLTRIDTAVCAQKSYSKQERDIIIVTHQ